MPGGFRVIPDDRPEAVIRKSLWRWWTGLVAFIAWLTWFAYITGNQDPSWRYVWIPILASFAGCGAGWLFGYRWGVEPLFTGVYLFQKKDEG